MSKIKELTPFAPAPFAPFAPFARSIDRSTPFENVFVVIGDAVEDFLEGGAVARVWVGRDAMRRRRRVRRCRRGGGAMRGVFHGGSN